MTRVELLPHPDTPEPAIDEFSVTAIPTPDGGLTLHYALVGDIDDLRLPRPAEVSRKDGLWHHTCFELFVRIGQLGAYREYNFSPSDAWQAYDFAAYRAGSRHAAVAPPKFSWARDPERLAVHVMLDEAHLPGRTRIRLALAAVLEDRRGTLSYWALVHPATHPDFHHPDAFALELIPFENRSNGTTPRFPSPRRLRP